MSRFGKSKMQYSHEDVLSANKRYYNMVAEQYKQNESYAYSKSIVKEVSNTLTQFSHQLSDRDMFLDFGCGSGFLSELVYKKKLFESIVGIDISDVQVNLYNQKFDNNIAKAIVGDITSIPYNDAIFSMASCYSVLHHILDYKAVIKEITRILKPNGILYADFEPAHAFRKIMSIPLSIRRKIFDRTPMGLDDLEFIAEYHHNIEKGIDRVDLINFLKTDYKILKVAPRFPEGISKPFLYSLTKVNWVFAPYFYFVAQKKF